MRTRPFIFVFLLTLLLSVSCGSDDSNDGTIDSPSGAIDSLASLKSAFDNGSITHVDYKTLEQRELLNEIITEMELLNQGDNVVDYAHIKITSKADSGVSHRVRLAMQDDPNLAIVDGVRVSAWAASNVMVNGASTSNFKPYVLITTSEITSTGLNALDDKLQINFKKQ